jgi:rhodanese-related sulfurtransferase
MAALTVDDVKRLLDRGEKVTFIDARNPIAWSASKVKVPGAIRVPLDEASEHVAALPRDRLLIAYCT